MLRTCVETGSFRISKSCPELLTAALATCVGVAVVDRAARVGGLYHILLPEQGWSDSGFDPEICAATGMPRFLEELQRCGCTTAGMEATLAGGALFGDISELDVDLDLGGRTVEIVNRILKRTGIPVVKSETGGYFGCVLQLNLLTLQCEITPSFLRPHGHVMSSSRLHAKDLDGSIAQIKPIPQVALKIIRMIQSDDYSLRDIARQIRHDQVMSARILKTCNSTYIGPKEAINSIDQAIVMLGGRLVGQLIVSSCIDQFFGEWRQSYSMSRGGLYHHAISTAIVAEHISKVTRCAAPDLAYTAGLLHDIGKVLLDQHVAPAMPLLYRMLVIDGEELLKAERSLLGISHAEAGARLAELWAFPQSLQDVIAHHADPRQSTHDGPLTHLVYLADLLVSRFDAGHDLDRIGTDALSDTLCRLGLETESLPKLISQIPWKVLDTPGYF